MNNAAEIPFSYIEKNFMVVPVKINDSVTKNFILDTGIGLNLISKSLCEKVGCKINGSHTGKRMSGQEVTVPISQLKSLSLAELRLTEVPVGVFDMEQLMPGADIGGFLSLSFFKNTPFTVDYSKNVLRIENASSLKNIKSIGSAVPIQIDQHDIAVSIQLPIILPNGREISAEVDTGSQALILDERFMSALGIKTDDKDVRNNQGKDETGHTFNRYFTILKGPVHLPKAPEMKVESLNVMFQKIIYEGLVGQYFLQQFTVTYNLPDSEMIFRIPAR